MLLFAVALHDTFVCRRHSSLCKPPAIPGLYLVDINLKLICLAPLKGLKGRKKNKHKRNPQNNAENSPNLIQLKSQNLIDNKKTENV